MRFFLLCNPSSSSLSPPPSTTTNGCRKLLLYPTQKPSLILRSLTGVALSINILFSSPISPLPSPSIAVEFTSSISQLDCLEEDQQREDYNRFERAPELVSNEEIVKEAWEIVNDSYLGSGSNRWSPQSWLV